MSCPIYRSPGARPTWIRLILDLRPGRLADLPLDEKVEEQVLNLTYTMRTGSQCRSTFTASLRGKRPKVVIFVLGEASSDKTSC
jgi:hypothetical protein